MHSCNQEIKQLQSEIFKIKDRSHFNDICIRIFQLQAEYNPIYKKYLELLGKSWKKIKKMEEIPFLPISFFKTHKVLTGSNSEEIIFESSGTTQSVRSKHYIVDGSLYERTFLAGFELFFGNPKKFSFLALLPSYLERKGSSLVYMVKGLMDKTVGVPTGFFLNNYNELEKALQYNMDRNISTVLIGVSFGLLDFIKERKFQLSNTLIIETGGMKGRGKELVRDELHHILKSGFGVNTIHSEYGMTELLSQAYAVKDGLFECPPWMKIIIREINDPFSQVELGRTGGVNIIDLANLWSCCFIETQDLGKKYKNSRFEILGRIDNSELRGCNLMMFDG